MGDLFESWVARKQVEARIMANAMGRLLGGDGEPPKAPTEADQWADPDNPFDQRPKRPTRGG